MHVKLGLVQYDPVLKEVRRNVDRVQRLVERLRPGDVDILLLPEMGMTGYMFDSFSDIEPYLEDFAGPSVTWAKETAFRLGCYVLVGYPEKGDKPNVAFNSLAIANSTGVMLNYRKHFLYDTDKSWATAGDGFESFSLELSAGRGSLLVSPAICMDLNPQDFVAPFDLFEYASFAKAHKVDLLLCAMNWLASEPPLVKSTSQDDWPAVSQTLSYWATRLSPLMGSNVVFAACNRAGTEKGTSFTGTSCVMSLGDKPTVIDYAGQSEEKLLMVDVEMATRP